MSALPSSPPSSASSSAPDSPINVVALSEPFDLVTLFPSACEPGLRLLRPEEVEDPSAIEFALAWCPGPEDFARYPNLRMVSSIAAGVDNILAAPSLPQTIPVCRIRDQGQADMMAGFAAWHVVWHHRRIATYIAAQARHDWERSFRAPRPAQTRVGILGYGLMGRSCARVIAAMGYPVTCARHSPGESDLPGVELICGAEAIAAVAQRSDILINVLPLTEDTRDLMDLDFFAQMPRGAALIQLGRGEHLVEADLLRALDLGYLGSASVDVLRIEPPAPDHPFWDRPEILLTPHKASDPARDEILHQLAMNIAAVHAGQTPPGAIDRAAGY